MHECMYIYGNKDAVLHPERRERFYSKNASSVAIFLEVVHCSVDEYLR